MTYIFSSDTQTLSSCNVQFTVATNRSVESLASTNENHQQRQKRPVMKDNATRLKTPNDNTTESNVGDQMIQYTTHKATNGNTADSTGQ